MPTMRGGAQVRYNGTEQAVFNVLGLTHPPTPPCAPLSMTRAMNKALARSHKFVVS